MTDCSLTLTPAKLVVKIEDPASVNCSTSNTDVDIIGWEVTQGGVTKANKSSVSWSVQKLNDFLPTPPKCYVTLGSGTQCEKSLHITVYKLPDNVSVSASPDAVMTEGKEHQLMCYISNVAPAQNLTVIWFQENKRVMEEKYSNSTLTPITVHSFFNVTAKREYNGTRFHCKAELHLGSDEQKIVPNVTSYSYTAIVNCKFSIQLLSAFNIMLISILANCNLQSCLFIDKPLMIDSTSTNAGVYICIATNNVGTSLADEI
uniref:Ig-like domain-containing protein n=1 Tax=Echeneis naucrates TaxID=173247 RepID=A0A665UEF6_ECHNA